VGTLFTLFVIPVVYTYLSRRAFIESDETALGPEGGHGNQGTAAPQPVPAAE
jgi:hypothetical protein